jgi:hypothetical protein
MECPPGGRRPLGHMLSPFPHPILIRAAELEALRTRRTPTRRGLRIRWDQR